MLRRGESAGAALSSSTVCGICTGRVLRGPMRLSPIATNFRNELTIVFARPVNRLSNASGKSKSADIVSMTFGRESAQEIVCFQPILRRTGARLIPYEETAYYSNARDGSIPQ